MSEAGELIVTIHGDGVEDQDLEVKKLSVHGVGDVEGGVVEDADVEGNKQRVQAVQVPGEDTPGRRRSASTMSEAGELIVTIDRDGVDAPIGHGLEDQDLEVKKLSVHGVGDVEGSFVEDADVEGNKQRVQAVREHGEDTLGKRRSASTMSEAGELIVTIGRDGVDAPVGHGLEHQDLEVKKLSVHGVGAVEGGVVEDADVEGNKQRVQAVRVPGVDMLGKRRSASTMAEAGELIVTIDRDGVDAPVGHGLEDQDLEVKKLSVHGVGDVEGGVVEDADVEGNKQLMQAVRVPGEDTLGKRRSASTMSEAGELIVTIDRDGVDAPVGHGLEDQDLEVKKLSVHGVGDVDGGVVEEADVEGNKQRVQAVRVPGEDPLGKRLELEQPMHGGVKVEDENLKRKKQWISDMRGVLMVLASLAASASYQAGLSPPGGVWQEDKPGVHVAGEAIMFYKHPIMFIWFKVTNAMAFMTSVIIMIMLSHSHDNFFKTSSRMSALQVSTIFGVGCLMVAYTLGSSPEDPLVGFAYVLVPVVLCGLMYFVVWICRMVKSFTAKWAIC